MTNLHRMNKIDAYALLVNDNVYVYFARGKPLSLGPTIVLLQSKTHAITHCIVPRIFKLSYHFMFCFVLFYRFKLDNFHQSVNAKSKN